MSINNYCQNVCLVLKSNLFVTILKSWITVSVLILVQRNFCGNNTKLGISTWIHELVHLFDFLLQIIVVKDYLSIKFKDSFFSLLRQEYPPILTSGEMLSHPGGRDKPVPEVIPLWRHRTSTPNNLEVAFSERFRHIILHIFRQASSWIANLRHLDGIPESLSQCGVRFY